MSGGHDSDTLLLSQGHFLVPLLAEQKSLPYKGLSLCPEAGEPPSCTMSCTGVGGGRQAGGSQWGCLAWAWNGLLGSWQASWVWGYPQPA